jgi:hypothetical protein
VIGTSGFDRSAVAGSRGHLASPSSRPELRDQRRLMVRFAANSQAPRRRDRRAAPRPEARAVGCPGDRRRDGRRRSIHSVRLPASSRIRGESSSAARPDAHDPARHDLARRSSRGAAGPGRPRAALATVGLHPARRRL